MIMVMLVHGDVINRDMQGTTKLCIKFIKYVTMTEKMGPDEEKADFAFLAFSVLYYINKACVKI